MSSGHPEIALPPLCNWYLNKCCDVWSSPFYFQKTKNRLILPMNEFFRSQVSGLYAYGAKNCVVFCQVHGLSVRYSFTLKIFENSHEKVSTVSFARCLKTPKLFIGSEHGAGLIYHFDEDRLQIPDDVSFMKFSHKFSRAVSSSDWADNNSVFLARDNHIIQWDLNKSIKSVEFPAPSGNDGRIDLISTSKLNPLLIAIAHSGGIISVIQIENLDLSQFSVLSVLNNAPGDICSLAFPFEKGEFKNGLIASISKAGMLKVWELDSNKQLCSNQFEIKSGKHSNFKSFYSITFIPKKRKSCDPQPDSDLEAKSDQNDSTEVLSLSESVQISQSDQSGVSETSDSLHNETFNVESSPSSQASAMESISSVENVSEFSYCPVKRYSMEEMIAIIDGTSRRKLKPSEDDNSPYLKLMVSKVNGDVLLVDVPLKLDLSQSNFITKRLTTYRLSHSNIVFNISIVNPFHYSSDQNVRIIKPYWEMFIYAISISLDRQIILWDLTDLRSKSSFQTLSQQVHDLQFNPTDNTLLAISCGDGLKIWKFAHHRRSSPAKDHPYPSYYRINSISKHLPSNVKVLCSAWMPAYLKRKSNLLAVGLYDGQVLVFDVDKHLEPPEYCKPYPKGTERCYSLSWGPIPENQRAEITKKNGIYALYSNGDVLLHIKDNKTLDFDELISGPVHYAKITECVWKDNDYLAVGYSDGVVIIYNNNKDLIPIIKLEDLISTEISCIRWHPDHVQKFNEYNNLIKKDQTKFESWIAIASRDITIHLVDLYPLISRYIAKKHQDIIISKQSKHVLIGHTDRVISLSWSTSVDQLIASCSADYTVQVWSADSGVGLYNYRGHVSRPFCVTWAPWRDDLIFSGGDDSTIQAWRTGFCPNKLPPTNETVEDLLKRVRFSVPPSSKDESLTEEPNFDKLVDPLLTKDDKIIPEIESSNEVPLSEIPEISEDSCLHKSELLQTDSLEDEITPTPTIIKVSSEDSSISTPGTYVSQEIKSTTQSSPSLKTKSRSSSGSSSSHSSILSKLRNAGKSMNEYTAKEKKKSLLPLSNITENCSTKLQAIKDIEYLMSKKFSIADYSDDPESAERNLIFLGRREINELCEKEIENHLQNKNYWLAFQVSFLNGNTKEMILEASKSNQLNDWMVAMSASISREFWSKVCLLYAAQLEKSNDATQAAFYYVSVHHINDAVRVLIKAGLFKEALILVKSHQFTNDILIRDIINAWAASKQSQTNLESAAKLYVANSEPEQAASCLKQRQDDPKCQSLAKVLESINQRIQDST